MLFAIEKQLAVYRQRIEELFARHPDHDLFGSLPGAGTQDRSALALRDWRRPPSASAAIPKTSNAWPEAHR